MDGTYTVADPSSVPQCGGDVLGQYCKNTAETALRDGHDGAVVALQVFWTFLGSLILVLCGVVRFRAHSVEHTVQDLHSQQMLSSSLTKGLHVVQCLSFLCYLGGTK